MKYTIPEEFKENLGKITQLFSTFITDERFAKMQKVLQTRSRQVLTIFENTHHAHNISAILRSVDCFGFMEIIFLYSNSQIRFRPADAIDRGASQWLLLKRLTDIKACAKLLKQNDYLIALVSLPDFSRTSSHFKEHIPAFSSQQFDTETFQKVCQNKKIALIFGSELLGVSKEWSDYADMYVNVEMKGFCESLNVSVCAGILLQTLRNLWDKQKQDILLAEEEQKIILEYWLARDYAYGYTFLRHKHPSFLPWYEFIKKAGFYSSFQKIF